MEGQDRRIELILEHIKATLVRNRGHVLIICEGLVMPDSVVTRHLESDIDNIVLTSHIRQDNLPIIVNGDVIVIHRKRNE